jgi:hypothetical protein
LARGATHWAKAEADFRTAQQLSEKLIAGVGGAKPALADLRHLGGAEAGLGRLAIARGQKPQGEQALRRAASFCTQALAIWPQHFECNRDLEQIRADLKQLAAEGSSTRP